MKKTKVTKVTKVSIRTLDNWLTKANDDENWRSKIANLLLNISEEEFLRLSKLIKK